MLTRAGKTANLVSTLKLAEQSGAKMQEAKLRVKISQIIIFDTKLCLATLRYASLRYAQRLMLLDILNPCSLG
jgi:hypothetical protein